MQWFSRDKASRLKGYFEDRRVFTSTAGDQDDSASLKLQFQAASATILCAEASSELISRLPLMALVSATLVIGVAFVEQAKQLPFSMLWFLLALGQLVFLRNLALSNTLQQIYRQAMCVVIGTMMWWALLPLFHIGEVLIWNFLLAFLILSVGNLSWPRRYLYVLTVLFALCCCFGFYMQRYPIFILLILFFLIVGAGRLSAINYLNLVSRAAYFFLGRYCESSTAFTLSTIRLLAYHLTLVADAKRALIVYQNDRAEVLSGIKVEESKLDKIFVLGVSQKLNAQVEQEGIVNFNEFGDQFRGPFHDWFHYNPKDLFFVSLTAVINEAEQKVNILVPLTFGARLVGSRRTFKILVGIASLVRVALAAARSRFHSSDIISSTERSVSEREHELNEVVHLVNNVVQNIALHCDTIKDELKQIVASDKHSLVCNELNQVEAAARGLSLGVSDIKRLKELLGSKAMVRISNTLVMNILEELKFFGEQRASRRKEKFVLDNEVAPNIGVKVASPEFLETTLRLLIVVASRRLDEGGTLRVHAKQVEDSVQFIISDTGRRLTEQEIKRSQDFSTDEDLSNKYIRAALNFAKLSGGTFEINPSNGPSSAVFPNHMILYLEACEIQGNAQIKVGEWALFVDDNEQVTTFYSRVAEALNLSYSVASSVSAAQAIVQAKGKPRLVITDIQLGESSGLDLVKNLREKFGVELPVIVVSGNTRDFVEGKVDLAGATKYLSKPVGRSRLFSEIKEILSL